jgi:hypothetical protein
LAQPFGESWRRILEESALAESVEKGHA